MVAESHAGPGKEPVEDLVDELIRDIMKEAGHKPKEAIYQQDPLTAALLDVAARSLSRPGTEASTLERLMLSQALATALADSLAPALAKALTPEIMKALGHLSAPQEADNKPVSVGPGPERSGRSNTKQ